MASMMVCSRCGDVVHPGARGPVWSLVQHWRSYHGGVPQARVLVARRNAFVKDAPSVLTPGMYRPQDGDIPA